MGMISVPVVLKEGTIMTRLNYSVHVKVFKTVPVLVKSKSRYGEISHSDTQSELKDVTALLLSGKKIKESFQRGELRSQRYLNAGTILTNRNTELMPDVPKSTLISLMVKYDALALKMDVTTLEDGFVGDTVKVMSPKYKKVLLAKLINDTEAEYIN